MEQSPASLLLHFASEAPLVVPRRPITRSFAKRSRSSAVTIDLDSDHDKEMEQTTEKTTEKTEDAEEAEAAPEPKFKCAICLGAYVRPTTLKGCGHVFCGACIAQALTKRPKKCPMCKTKTRKRQLLEIYLS